MKILYLLLLVTVIQFQSSCKSDKTKEILKKEEAINFEKPKSNLEQTFTISEKTLTKNFMTWYNYTYYNIKLSQDFIGLDIDSAKIDKATFLNNLLTENVVAFKTKILKGQPVYQLFRLSSYDESIKTTMKQMASREIQHFKMEGTEMPDYNFTDLKGKIYNKSSTKGKILILKCWFIHCVPCVKEFPELNKFVVENLGRNDILFVSFALDSKKDLLKFFEIKDFKYATVPDMKDYIVSELNITQFPTHLLIGKDGKIKKIVDRFEDLLPFIQIEKEIL